MRNKVKMSDAIRKAVALLLALGTALGPATNPAFSASQPFTKTSRLAGRHGYSDTTPGGDLPGERLFRSLLWNLSQCVESRRGTQVQGFARDSDGEWPEQCAIEFQSKPQ